MNVLGVLIRVVCGCTLTFWHCFIVPQQHHCAMTGLFLFTQAKCILSFVPSGAHHFCMAWGVEERLHCACWHSLHSALRPYGVYSKAFSGRNADACLMVFRLCANVWRCPTLGKCEVEWVASEENIFGADVLALAQWPRHAWIWYEVKIVGLGWMVAIFCSDVPLLQNLIVSTVFGIYCAIVRVRRSQIMRTGLRRPPFLLSEHPLAAIPCPC